MPSYYTSSILLGFPIWGPDHTDDDHEDDDAHEDDDEEEDDDDGTLLTIPLYPDGP